MYYVYVVHTGSVAISYDVLQVNAKIKKICDHIRGSGAILYAMLCYAMLCYAPELVCNFFFGIAAGLSSGDFLLSL